MKSINPFGSNIEVEVSVTNDDAPGWILVTVKDTFHRSSTGFILNEDELVALTNALNEAMADSYETEGAKA